MSEAEQTIEATEQWAIVEIFGHRSHAGRISEIEQYGTKMIRIEVPWHDGSFQTHDYGGGAIFSIRRTAKNEVMQAAEYSWPAECPDCGERRLTCERDECKPF